MPNKRKERAQNMVAPLFPKFVMQDRRGKRFYSSPSNTTMPFLSLRQKSTGCLESFTRRWQIKSDLRSYLVAPSPLSKFSSQRV